MIPFVDLWRQHAPLARDIHAWLEEALRQSAFILGRQVALFEQEFAGYCGARFGVGVANGTDALTLALRGLGVGPGDCVLTVPNSFIATAEAVTNCGATPAFVEVDPVTYTMDPAQLERYLRLSCRRNAKGELIDIRTGGRLRAVIPVHLYGHPADMDATCELARGEGLVVIEDAAQAHGALYKGRRVGSLGDCACFSFYPAKNLGAMGDAGMVVTGDEKLYRRLTLLRDHGKAAKYEHAVVGCNSRLDELQAGVLRFKLSRLDAWNAARRERAADYARLLPAAFLDLPETAEGCEPVYHLYVVRVANREALTDSLSRQGIGWGIHYPVALHLTTAYSHLGYRRGEFPIAEQYADEIVSLPMFAELTTDEVAEVASAVLAHLGIPHLAVAEVGARL